MLTAVVILSLKQRHEDIASKPAMEERGPASQVSNAAAPDPCQNIYRTFCQSRGETRDPTGSVHPDMAGELEALRIYEEIIRANPDWSSEQVDEALVNEVYTKKRIQRVRSAYEWARSAIERFIDRQAPAVFDAKLKTFLKKRIRSTKLELPPPASVYADEPDIFTKNDIYYQRLVDGTIRVRVGGAYLISVKSWFNMVFTMAHEFAHTIDPCELKVENVRPPAYSNLENCFADHGMINLVRSRSDCGENDQFSEAFADWVAVQVTAELLAKYSKEFDRAQLLHAAVNSVRDLCDEDNGLREVEESFHPSPQVRIEKIFGTNPSIRDLLGCAPVKSNSCSFNWEKFPLSPERGRHAH